jgi:hypothetical protein
MEIAQPKSKIRALHRAQSWFTLRVFRGGSRKCTRKSLRTLCRFLPTQIVGSARMSSLGDAQEHPVAPARFRVASRAIQRQRARAALCQGTTLGR